MEVDFVLYAQQGILALEAKSGSKAHPTEARRLKELLHALKLPGINRNAWRLGLIVTQGRELERLHPGVWAIPLWRLFAPAK